MMFKVRLRGKGVHYVYDGPHKDGETSVYVCVYVSSSSLCPVCEDDGHGRFVSTAGGFENRTLFPVLNALLPFGL